MTQQIIESNNSMVVSDQGFSSMERDHPPSIELGMISHKKSLITIFGHKHKIKNFVKKIDIFHLKNFNSFQFWFIFGIKLGILNQNYIKMINKF